MSRLIDFIGENIMPTAALAIAPLLAHIAGVDASRVLASSVIASLVVAVIRDFTIFMMDEQPPPEGFATGALVASLTTIAAPYVYLAILVGGAQ